MQKLPRSFPAGRHSSPGPVISPSCNLGVGQLLRNELSGVPFVQKPVCILDVRPGTTQCLEMPSSSRQHPGAGRVESTQSLRC